MERDDRVYLLGEDIGVYGGAFKVTEDFLDRFGVTFGGLEYDFFLLFNRDATWGPTAPRPLSSGATVIGDSDRLAASAASLLR